MSTNFFRRGFGLWGVSWAVLALMAAPEASLSQVVQPVITSIQLRGSNVTVEVNVPPGVQRVVLESRSRLGSGAWVPAAVAASDGAGGQVTFRLPHTQQSELLRVRADVSQPLPAAFYTGTNSFWGGPASYPGGPVVAVGGGLEPYDGTTVPGAGGAGREVVESDIWKVKGDTLYFFNQYRGLQVIDIGDPDRASVRGTLELPAAGEQMYLAGSNHVVLLAHNGCGYDGEDSRVVIVGVGGGQPRVVRNLVVPGRIQESRMVGTALYVASQTYRPVSGSDTWEWGTRVSAFDLADPAMPVERNPLWYPGYGNVVAATDLYLFVVTQDPTNWWQSVVRLVDITAPEGTMAPYASLRLAGRVGDKFKLNYSGGVLTTISEDTHTGSGVVTRLETFRLPDPRSAGPTGLVKLGELLLGAGERLHATRFDQDRVYVVTFLQIDPLWVVDLSEPSRPRIAGWVDVPGWSTYIEPLGERLVTVGVESGRVAVSLFDVQDPARPSLLSRVRLGENYSWSEANNDEKAFAVLDDLGLILVPYSGDTTNGWTSRVQLIDLNAGGLVARGVIEHPCQPRRAAFARNRILSVSGWELLSVDATDRDHPVVRDELALAWPVDRLFVKGDYLLEIAAGLNGWGRQEQASVRVTPAWEPNQVLRQLALGTLPVSGAALRGERLYVVQSPSQGCVMPLDTTVEGDVGEPEAKMTLTVVGLEALPELRVLGQASAGIPWPALGGEWEPVWPQPDLVVWVGGYVDYGWWGPGDPLILGGTIAAGGYWFWPVASYGGGQLVAFDVSRPSEPKLVSQLNLATNGWWNFSRPVGTGSLIYLSHQALEPALTNNWRQRTYLDVIDYADPVSPTVRKPVNIPGTLQGISHAGELLYTRGYHWTSEGVASASEYLDASAYDGVAAYWVASLALPEAWPNPLRVWGSHVLLGRTGNSGTEGQAGALETWTLADTGEFTLEGSIKLELPGKVLVARDDLLAVELTDRSVRLFDATNPAALQPLGGALSPGCVFFELDQAQGARERGLWIPLGMYGVSVIRLAP